jgi:DNA-binding CsgD family transcriptional regulator
MRHLILGYRCSFRGKGIFIAIQTILLLGLAAIGAEYYYSAVGLYGGGGTSAGLAGLISAVSALAMIGIYALAFLSFFILGDKKELRARRNAGIAASAAVLAKILLDITAMIAHKAPSPAWSLGGYILIGLALTAYAFFLLGLGRIEGLPAIRFLYRAYAVSALIFAPMGLLEWLVNRRIVNLPQPLSLDYAFYLAWNLSSVAALAISLRPDPRVAGDDSLLPAVPEAKAASLGLTSREVDMALLIARGFSNKEIAASLGISASTVRTHIYNLYRKAGARSRVELISILRP